LIRVAIDLLNDRAELQGGHAPPAPACRAFSGVSAPGHIPIRFSLYISLFYFISLRWW